MIVSGLFVGFSRLEDEDEEVLGFELMEALEEELDHWVEEADFISVFEFVINMGGLASLRPLDPLARRDVCPPKAAQAALGGLRHRE